MAEMNVKSAAECKWDCASFGEIMLRFDPGFGRVRSARSFQVWVVRVEEVEAAMKRKSARVIR